MLFSLSGFAQIMHGRIKVQLMQDGKCKHEAPCSNLSQLRDKIIDSLSTHTSFDSIFSIEGETLIDRCRLSEASHYLSDAGYRLFQGEDLDKANSVLLLGASSLQNAVRELEYRVDGYN